MESSGLIFLYTSEWEGKYELILDNQTLKIEEYFMQKLI